ncbi:MAG: KH domain-containing protein [Clostridia bacterium]|nr:KH domain-containing protein [Clostridia bacterium]
MQELLAALAKGLVKDPENVSVVVDAPDEEGVSVYHLHVSQDDMGRVIGKQGKIAKSIRTIMKATALRNGQKIQVEID